MELTPFFKLPSSQLIGSLGSVAPIVLMILLLLLCFPFKKKKHHLSIRTRKKDLNMSELIDLTKLEDGLPPERKSLADQCLPKANTFPPSDINSDFPGPFFIDWSTWKRSSGNGRAEMVATKKIKRPLESINSRLQLVTK